MTLDEILAQLNPEQAEAAGTLDGPVLVLAGAGTGKTRVITYRIAGMLASGISPHNILGLTFTNKAAREMRERLAALVDPNMAKKVTLGTFHAFCVKLLRREASLLGYLPGFTIADESDQQGLLKQAAAAKGLTAQGLNIAEAAAAISDQKNRLITPARASAIADTEWDVAMAALYGEYQSMLEMQNMIDFDDMLLLAYRLFDEFPDVLKKYQEKYQYLLVDEYQDTNDAQFAVVKQLAGEKCNLCVVGDDDQSIYSWRGANIDNILGFPNIFPGTKVVKLEQNYRSTKRILEAANAVIGSNSNRHAKALWSNLGEGEPVRVVTVASGEAEAEFIANMIKQDMTENEKRTYKDYAVLYRSNHLSRQLEQTFRQLGIPYRLVGGQEFFKRKEIKDAVSYLKLLVNPMDNQSLLRILATPPRGLAAKAVDILKRRNAETMKPMAELLDDEVLIKSVTAKGAAAAQDLKKQFDYYKEQFQTPGQLAQKINGFLRAVGYLDGLQVMYKDYKDAVKRRENVDEFINAVAIYEQKAGEPETLENYLESFALLEENDRSSGEEENADAVTLLTVHAAKGLEYPVVFQIALEADIFPHERAVNEGATDEELRLFYVSITRAREKLYLCRARNRMQRGMPQLKVPSPFLTLLPDDVERAKGEDLIKTLDADDMRAAFANIFNLLKED